MLGNFYFLWVYLTNLKCARIIRRPESHLLIHLPYFYHLNSKNLQYSISFSIEHIVLILILNVQYSIFNITNQYRILIKALHEPLPKLYTRLYQSSAQAFTQSSTQASTRSFIQSSTKALHNRITC